MFASLDEDGSGELSLEELLEAPEASRGRVEWVQTPFSSLILCRGMWLRDTFTNAFFNMFLGDRGQGVGGR